MKSKIIFASAFLLTATTLFSQQKQTSTSKPSTINQCDDLKKENDLLLNAFQLNSPLAVDSENDIDGKVVKVIGDKKTQNITVEILFTNKIENCAVLVHDIYSKTIKVVTLNGDVLFSKVNIIPNNGYTTLNTDVPIKFSFVFGPLLPTETYFKLIEVNFQVNESKPNRPRNTKFEFHDLKIEWK